MIAASVKRINRGEFTDADVVSVLMHIRESHGYPILTDIAHLIAHPKRDRGRLTSTVLDAYSRMAFFRKYQRADSEGVPVNEDCDWWLKRFLLSQIDLSDGVDVRRKLGCPKSKIKKEIKSWFPLDETHPTHFRMKMSNGNVKRSSRVLEVIRYCARVLHAREREYYSERRIIEELASSFNQLGIKAARQDDFLLCLCLVFHNREYFKDDLKVGETHLSLRDGHRVGVRMTTHIPGANGVARISQLLFVTSMPRSRYFCKKTILFYDEGKEDITQLEFSFSSMADKRVETLFPSTSS